jgi:hypothetical protein
LPPDRISVNRTVDRSHFPIDDQIGLDDQALRRWMAVRIVRTFIAGNLSTLTVLGGPYWPDRSNLPRA